VDAVGLAAPGGRTSRRVIAVDVGEARGPAAADGRVAIPPHAEVDALGAMRASVQGRAVGTDAPLEPAIALVREMTTARYAALVIGAPATLPGSVARGLAAVATVAIGPRASAADWKPVVAVDTGVAGIHEGGTAFRMDDVPLPLRPALDGEDVRSAAAIVRALRERLEAGA